MFWKKKEPKALEDGASQPTMSDRIQEAVMARARRVLDEPRSETTVRDLKRQYQAFPSDKLADVLIKRARNKTAREGVGSALAVTVVEAAIPESAGLAVPAAVAGAAALIAADISYTTAVQMQLVLDMATLFECPFRRDDDEDVWWIFMMALGIRSVEEVGKVSSTVLQDAATKAFRKWLRTGVRKALQDWVRRKAGERVARYLAERYVLRLVPVANIGFSYWMNSKMTSQVGRVARRACKIRSGLFRPIDAISQAGGDGSGGDGPGGCGSGGCGSGGDGGPGGFEPCATKSDARHLVLPLIFWIGSQTENYCEEFLAFYSNATRRLALTDSELERAEQLIDREQASAAVIEELARVEPWVDRQALVSIALATAAIAGKKKEVQARTALSRVATALRIDFDYGALAAAIHYYDT